jgi:hypothetical protein
MPWMLARDTCRIRPLTRGVGGGGGVGSGVVVVSLAVPAEAGRDAESARDCATAAGEDELRLFGGL